MTGSTRAARRAGTASGRCTLCRRTRRRAREDCYNVRVIARDILAFVSRDWERVRQAKDHYWSERIARFGPAEPLRIGDDLRVRLS